MVTVTDKRDGRARRELWRLLEDARLDADRPTYRHIAERSGSAGSDDHRISESAVRRTFKGPGVPTWHAVRNVVCALGRDPEAFKGPWRKAHDEAEAMSAEPLSSADGEDVRVDYYPSTARFYSALTTALRSARQQLRLTYIRQAAPDTYAGESGAALYFSGVLRWAHENGRPVRRVVGVPVRKGRPLVDFEEWLRRHHDETTALRARRLYEVRVFEWAGKVDLRNIALLDDNHVFVTWSGVNSQDLRGHSVRSARYAQGYIESFELLYGANPPLEEYLDSL